METAKGISTMSPKLSKRMKFFLSYLAISLFIATMALLLVFIFWYPFPLSKAVGVTHLFLMMLVIDVIVGPILGFIVYKEGKKSLKFDLTIIILIQLLALGFGLYKIAEGRPVWIVFNVDRFELVKNNEVIIQHIEKIPEPFRQNSYLKPKFAATQFASDAKTRTADLMTELVDGVSIAQRPERYIPLEKAKNQILKRSQPLNLLNKYNTRQQVEQILSQYPDAKTYLPLSATKQDMTVLLNRKAEVIKIVDLRPWK